MCSEVTKVFCVGFQKTGTSSIGVALEHMNYRVVGYRAFGDYAEKSDLTMDEIYQRAYQLAEQYDAFKDTPWPLLYKELDMKYPKSKFILVIRDSDKWIKSAVQDFEGYHNAIHNLIYGVGYPLGNEKIWIDRYEKHNADVQAYFRDRPQDLLILHLDRGEVNWESICSFLDRDIPDIPWPHANKISQKKSMLFRKRLLSRLGLASKK